MLGSTDADAATRWRPWRSYAVLHLWALAVPSLFTRPATPSTRPNHALPSPTRPRPPCPSLRPPRHRRDPARPVHRRGRHRRRRPGRRARQRLDRRHRRPPAGGAPVAAAGREQQVDDCRCWTPWRSSSPATSPRSTTWSVRQRSGPFLTAGLGGPPDGARRPPGQLRRVRRPVRPAGRRPRRGERVRPQRGRAVRALPPGARVRRRPGRVPLGHAGQALAARPRGEHATVAA